MNTTLPSFALSLLPGVPGLCLTEVQHDAESVLLALASTHPSASCPLCLTPTTRLHSHYQRTEISWGITERKGIQDEDLVTVRRAAQMCLSGPLCPSSSANR